MRFIILLSLLWCFPGSAADLPYAVSAIPAGLFRHANAVKRFEDVRFEVKSIRQARFYRKVAYTILNEKGDDWADMSETYDRVLWGEPALEGTLYDARGQKIKSTKKTDFRDFSNVSEGTLAANDRVRSHNFYHKVYPYTIEYTIEQDYYATMFYPAWIPCPRTLLAVEQSRMTVILPEKETFRFKAINGAGGPVITTESGKSKYTWEISNFPALQGEYAAPFLTDIVPLVMMAPSRFYIQGYEGDMQNWKEYGLFVQSLKQDKVSLPPAMQQQVHKLVDGLPDVPAKVDALYRFMQENTRYISIQLGIGGWQPFPAAFVAEKRYGDCKALTNYMQALLKEAGIPSGYTVIKSKNKSFHPDFPSSQFDHVILCVPQPADSIWLECTSQTLPAGYLGNFTHDRFGVYVDETGGHLVRTPSYGHIENLQLRRIQAIADPEADELNIRVQTRYRAMQQDDLHALLRGQTKEQVEKYLREEIQLPQYDVVSFEYKEYPGRLPEIQEELQLKAANYFQVSGKRLFLQPNLLTRSARKFPQDTARRFPVVLDFAFTDIDSVEIIIPEGYVAEAVPKNQLLQTPYGTYQSSIELQPRKILYYRRQEQYAGRFDPALYPEMTAYFDKIFNADRARIVLVKKTD